MNPESNPGFRYTRVGGPSVNDSIDWRSVHHTTRVRATATTFGWPVRVLLTLPPLVVMAVLGSFGVYGEPVVAAAIGVPQLCLSIWWVLRVWAPGHDRAPRGATGGAVHRSPGVPGANPGLSYLQGGSGVAPVEPESVPQLVHPDVEDQALLRARQAEQQGEQTQQQPYGPGPA